MERHPVFHIPGERIQEDGFVLLRSIEDIGKQDPIVVSIRFVAEHHDLDAVPVAGQDLFDDPGSRHPVSNHDYFMPTRLLHSKTASLLVPRTDIEQQGGQSKKTDAESALLSRDP